MIKGWMVNDTQVVRYVSMLAPRTYEELRKTVSRLGIKLQRRVRQDYLSGQALHVRTDVLRGSIDQVPITDGTRIASVVSTNVGYGIAWENGFDRKIGAGARGGPRALMGKARERYFLKHPPGVKHYPPRAFLKPPLHVMENDGEIRHDIDEALGEAVK